MMKMLLNALRGALGDSAEKMLLRPVPVAGDVGPGDSTNASRNIGARLVDRTRY